MPRAAALSQRLAQGRLRLRAGDWLTEARLRVYPAMILAFFALAILVLVATSHGGKDLAGRPLGVDFSGQWVAGTEVLAGHPAQPYDNEAHAARQAAAFGPSDSYLPWNYPPFALGLAAVFASLPYLPALFGWMGATLLFYLAAVRRALQSSGLALSSTTIAALAFPAVAVNVLHGQNGCLSAALLTFGGFCLFRRPLLAGVLLGFLAYKPQFVLAVPLVLLAGGFGRGALSFCVTLIVMTLISVLAFGLTPWHDFWGSLAFSRTVILEGGGLESFKLQSAFAAVRLVGGSVHLAYAVQGATTLAVLAALAALWHSDRDERVKVAGLLTASLLVTPYAVDYDMVLLGPALAALVASRLETGFSPYDKSVFAFVWLVPLFARLVASGLHVPLGLIATGVLFVWIVRGRSQLNDEADSRFSVQVNPQTINPENL